MLHYESTRILKDSNCYTSNFFIELHNLIMILTHCPCSTSDETFLCKPIVFVIENNEVSE